MTTRQVGLILIIIGVVLLLLDNSPTPYPAPPEAAQQPKPQTDKIIRDDVRQQTG